MLTGRAAAGGDGGVSGVVVGGGVLPAGGGLEAGENVHLLPQRPAPLQELLLLAPVELVHLVELRVQPREELPRRPRRRRVVGGRERFQQLRLVLVPDAAATSARRRPRQQVPAVHLDTNKEIGE